MGWRNWSYSKKGGLIFLIIGLAVLVISFPAFFISFESALYSSILNILEKSGLIIVTLGFYGGIGSGIFASFIFLLIYFLIGNFFGWLYGKIKSNKQKESIKK